MQLAWCGTGMPEDLLVDIAMHHLESSRYKRDVDQVQISHTATGSSYNTLDALYDALTHLERYRGISYGSKHSETKPDPRRFGGKFKGGSQGLVSAVSETDKDGGGSQFIFHKDSWIGAIDLEEKHVKHLRHIFRCALCRTNKHNFPQCPILTKTFLITKLVVDDKKGGVSAVSESDVPLSSTNDGALGQAASVVLATPIGSCLRSSTFSSLAVTDPIIDSDNDIDHVGNVSLDLVVDNLSSEIL
jgi:hypothetical protein